MNLYDILACPICRVHVERRGDRLRCGQCRCEYPVVDGVPIMLPGGVYKDVRHEADLGVRTGYAPWLHRMILQSLPDDQVVVDVGSGNMHVDDPCIIRMDIVLTPHVDLVGDLHALPFLPDSAGYILALAVFEHLRQPFKAADEIHRVLKPGGYAYAEANFVFPYHGYPHHYFNISIQGLREIFAQFAILRTGVAPYQMPGFALEAILPAYLGMFKPETATERAFAKMLKSALTYPLRYYDTKLQCDEAFRIAAGDYIIARKQAGSNSADAVIPQPLWKVYSAAPELQARYPEPTHIFEPDNLMFWAQREGRSQFRELSAYFDSVKPFSKFADPSHRFDRSIIRNLPPIPLPGRQWFTDERIGHESGIVLSWPPYYLDEAWLHVRRGEWAVLCAKIKAVLQGKLRQWRRALKP